MTKAARVRFMMFMRVVQFIGDNIAEFAAGGVVATQLDVLRDVIERIGILTGEQTGDRSERRFHTTGKSAARKNLRKMVSKIAGTARSMAYMFPGIELKFRTFRGDNDVKLMATARSFLTEAAPLEENFVAYEMDENFPDELRNLIEAFEASMGAPAAALNSQVEATADLAVEIKRGMNAVRTMRGAVINKFADDEGKLAAWKSASHVRKSSQEENLEETDEE